MKNFAIFPLSAELLLLIENNDEKAFLISINSMKSLAMKIQIKSSLDKSKEGEGDSLNYNG